MSSVASVTFLQSTCCRAARSGPTAFRLQPAAAHEVSVFRQRNVVCASGKSASSRSRAAMSAPTACASTSACRAAPHSACVGPLPTSFAVSLPVCVAVQHSGMWPSPLRLQPASQHHAERTRRHSAVAYDRPIKAASAAACCTSVAGCAQRHGAAARLEEERKSARSYCTVLAAVPLDVHRWQTASRSPRKP